MKILIIFLIGLVLGFGFVRIKAMGGSNSHSEVTLENFYDLSMKSIDGENIAFDSFKGKLLLIVNVASKCGFTKQYEGLQELYERYGPDKFIVLGIPANNFGFQEPGSNEQIKTFCSTKYNVTFPMTEKVSVKGSNQHPLYTFLTQNSIKPGPISWNFNKFLINQQGHVVSRYGSTTKPMSNAIQNDIERYLKNEK